MIDLYDFLRNSTRTYLEKYNDRHSSYVYSRRLLAKQIVAPDNDIFWSDYTLVRGPGLFKQQKSELRLTWMDTE